MDSVGRVGTFNVICGISGGMGCSVVAVLLHEATGEQIVCVFVDHYLLGKDEGPEVVRLFRDRSSMAIRAGASEQS